MRCKLVCNIKSIVCLIYLVVDHISNVYPNFPSLTRQNKWKLLQTKISQEEQGSFGRMNKDTIDEEYEKNKKMYHPNCPDYAMQVYVAKEDLRFGLHGHPPFWYRKCSRMMVKCHFIEQLTNDEAMYTITTDVLLFDRVNIEEFILLEVVGWSSEKGKHSSYSVDRLVIRNFQAKHMQLQTAFDDSCLCYNQCINYVGTNICEPLTAAEVGDLIDITE